MHASTDTCMHAQMCMYMHMLAYKHAWIYKCRHTYTDIHACLLTYSPHTYIFTCKYVCIHPCMSGYPHIYIHTYINRNIHTHSCTSVYIQAYLHAQNICRSAFIEICMHVNPSNPMQVQAPPAQMAQLSWSYFKPGFSGKPEEDAIAHLLRTNDWMETHNFPEESKVFFNSHR